MIVEVISKVDFKNSAIDWLVNRRPELKEVGITVETDLIDSRVIDSLTFVEFIFFLEELCGRPIEADGDVLETLRSFNAIYKHYF
jgi:acyl carrier protein